MQDDLELESGDGDGEPQGGTDASGTGTESQRPRGSRAKPQFSEEQNRWIGARLAREEDKRRAIESELTAEREKATNATQRISALEQELRLSRAENAVIAEATKLKADDPAIIFRLVRDDLQFGDDGKPKDVAALLEGYKKDHPKLFGAASTSGADGGKGDDIPAAGADLNAWFREQAANSKTRAQSSTNA